MSELRNLLDEIADGSKQYDVVERVVVGARRRRRVVRLAPVAVVVAVALAALGLWFPLHGGASDRGTGPVAHGGLPAGAGVDLIVGHTLYPAAGQRISLPKADVQQAHRVPGGGWLVVTGGATSDVWLIGTDGAKHPLLSDVDNVRIDGAGQRIAWTSGGDTRTGSGMTLSTARLAAGALTARHDTTVDDVIPMALFGTDGVVLAGVGTGGGFGPYDVWFADHGGYQPSTDHRGVSAVEGATADGTRLAGLVAADPTAGKSTLCLAELDPAREFRAGPKVCSDTLTATPGGLVSPTDFALVPATHGSTTELDGYQLGAKAPQRKGGWRLTGITGAAWSDDYTAVITYTDDNDHVHLARIRTDHPGTVTPVRLPAGASGAVTVVATSRPIG